MTTKEPKQPVGITNEKPSIPYINHDAINRDLSSLVTSITKPTKPVIKSPKPIHQPKPQIKPPVKQKTINPTLKHYTFPDVATSGPVIAKDGTALKYDTTVASAIHNSCGNKDGTSVISKPEQFDVLCGRGNAVKSNPGNLEFRRLVKYYKEQYIETISAELKTQIVKKILQAIEAKGGRFLKCQCSNTSFFWVSITRKDALKKIGQALREDATKIRAELIKKKSDSKLVPPPPTPSLHSLRKQNSTSVDPPGYVAGSNVVPASGPAPGSTVRSTTGSTIGSVSESQPSFVGGTAAGSTIEHLTGFATGFTIESVTGSGFAARSTVSMNVTPSSVPSNNDIANKNGFLSNSANNKKTNNKKRTKRSSSPKTSESMFDPLHNYVMSQTETINKLYTEIHETKEGMKLLEKQYRDLNRKHDSLMKRVRDEIHKQGLLSDFQSITTTNEVGIDEEVRAAETLSSISNLSNKKSKISM
mmetsp:Transcript_13568/g.16449  ORF Transcript_13568/g.16449 Transcript_13568/m.16449 type:complete len:474 (-) Transcript_13568:397-1818(-)